MRQGYLSSRKLLNVMRKCRNWQTSKTKDLVIIVIVWVQVPSSAVEFVKLSKQFDNSKYYLTQHEYCVIVVAALQRWRNWQTRTVQVRVVAIP